MRGFKYFIAGLLIAPALGCAAGGGVHISYPQPKTDQERAQTRAMGNLYLILRTPRHAGASLFNQAMKGRADFKGIQTWNNFDSDAGLFARTLGARLKKRGAHILAYRAPHVEEEKDPFIEELAPAGVLQVDFQSLGTGLSRENLEKKVTVGEGKTEKRISTKWTFIAELTLRARLYMHPEGRVLQDIRHTVRYTDTKTGDEKKSPNASRWYRRKQKAILDRAAKELTSRLGQVSAVRRKRTLFPDEKDVRSIEALKAAGKGDWEKASELWAERLEAGQGGWKDVMNLAVASEHAREFAEAERLYRKAREMAGTDPESAKVPWDVVFADVSGAQEVLGRRSQKASVWFAAPIAVMPFSDETTSVEGPDILRELLYKALAKGGYTMIDLYDVDRGLRSQGISQGGQLKGRHNSRYANVLGARRLFFGHITEFDDLMLGGYGKRHVGGELSLWDASHKDFLWKSSEPALTESAAIGDKAVHDNLSRQIMRGLYERIRSKPLGAESVVFIQRNLETLPLRLD